MPTVRMNVCHVNGHFKRNYLKYLFAFMGFIFLYYRTQKPSDNPSDNTVMFVVEEKKSNNVIDDKKNKSSEECELQPLLSLGTFLHKVQNPLNVCFDFKIFGGYAINIGYMNVPIPVDGQKWVCMDYESPHPGRCVIYSFGINNQWSFDDDMGAYGCKVYAFDPTMDAEDYKRSENVYFYNLGISNVTGLETMYKKKVKVARLEDIRKQLGHDTTIIDYLKMDIEGNERKVMEDIMNTSSYILEKYVGQIGMEIHFGEKFTELPRILEIYWNMFERLRCLGFKTAHTEPNSLARGIFALNQKPLPCCYEVVWINEKLLSLYL